MEEILTLKLIFPIMQKKTDLKSVTYVDTSIFALKKDIDKLAPVPADLSKLSNVVKNDVVQKTVYDQLVAKVNNIDTSDFVLKTEYQTGKAELEKKIHDVTYFVEKVKFTKLENKIPDISNLATKIVLTTVENKITDVSNLVRKQIIILKLQKLKINLMIIIMTNILQLQSLIV